MHSCLMSSLHASQYSTFLSISGVFQIGFKLGKVTFESVGKDEVCDKMAFIIDS